MMYKHYLSFALAALIANNVVSMEPENPLIIPTAQLAKYYMRESSEHFIKQFKQHGKIEINGCCYWHSSIKDSLLNTVTKFVPSNEHEIYSTIDIIISYAKRNQLPLFWPILDEHFQDTVKKHLEQHNLSKSRMSLMIFNSPQVHLLKYPENIKPLQKHSIPDWIAVLNDAFEQEDIKFTQSYCEIIAHDIETQSTKARYFEHYSGYLHNELVTIGSIFVTNDYAEISNIATLSKARNKGMAQSIMTTLILRVQQLGLRKLFLTTMTESVAEKLYKKLGFTTIATIDCYSLS